MATDPIEKYTDRITAWHRIRPKFVATVGETLRPIVDANAFIEGISAEFDLDTCIGVQLDVCGEWINLSRNVLVPIPDPWFRWDDEKRGWDMGYWKEPLDMARNLATLDDETYRRLLKARIRANQWDGTAEQAKEILKSYFNADTYSIIVDDKSTQETYYALSGKWPDHVTLELFRGEYLPLRTAGYRTYHYVNSIDETPLFGFDVDNSQIAGWDDAAWGFDPTEVITAP